MNGRDAHTVLVTLWGNPPMPDPLGLLMPVNAGPLNPDSWAVIITYEEEGYVKDKDAEKIDYADLLKQMQKDTFEANKEREKQGYSKVELVGWAAPPHYDQGVHKLFWAKQLKFGDEKEDTLNYNIRILGRRGVLVLNAVSTMSQLPEIERNAPKILAAIDFNPGNRYADFSEASGDKVASVRHRGAGRRRSSGEARSFQRALDFRPRGEEICHHGRGGPGGIAPQVVRQGQSGHVS